MKNSERPEVKEIMKTLSKGDKEQIDKVTPEFLLDLAGEMDDLINKTIKGADIKKDPRISLFIKLSLMSTYQIYLFDSYLKVKDLEIARHHLDKLKTQILNALERHGWE